MLDPASVPEVGNEETLSRFLVQRSDVRADHTLRPNRFIPPPDNKLSVTRDLNASPEEIWAIGKSVAEKNNQRLYGSGDLKAKIYRQHGLSPNPAPVEGNPNHIDVEGWPQSKDAKKMIALGLASSATFKPAPFSTEDQS